MTAGQHQHMQAHWHLRARHQRTRTRGRTPLLELLERSLDKGVLIEGRLCGRGLGRDVFTLDYRAFLASCGTYLEYAEAVARTVEVREPDDSAYLPATRQHDAWDEDRAGNLGYDAGDGEPDDRVPGDWEPEYL